MILVDGERQTTVAADDRGLAYGDGLFETVAVVRGSPALWPSHLRRLQRGCRALGLPSIEAAALAADLRKLFPPAGRADGVFKIIITRGNGGRGYARPDGERVRRIAIALPRPAHPYTYWRDGVRLHECRTRLPLQPFLPGIKHLNRLEQVLARAEWSDPGVADGLMLRDNGEPVEGTACNLFARSGERLLTPPVESLAVAGVMRERVLELAVEEGLQTAEAPLPWPALISADEVFLTNSVIGIWPVVAVAGRNWPVGEVATLLQRTLVAEGSVFDWLKMGEGACAE